MSLPLTIVLVKILERVSEMMRLCPNCQTERSLSEIFCEGQTDNFRCNWDLSVEPIRPAGWRPAPVIAAAELPSALRMCLNGHAMDNGDLVCLTCGADAVGEGGPANDAGNPDLIASDAPPAETVVDGWRLLHQLSGSDGVRERFIAERVEDQHQAVLTLYRPGAEPDPAVYDVLRRLPREHVPEILATGRWDGRAYEATEELTGGTLADLGLVADDLAGLRRIVEQIGQALHSFSEAGLRHRDLRPDTILVRGRDPLDLVIIGFGSARLSDFDLDIVSPLETSCYMAPEAIAGGVAAASDWWSLGMILLEQVTRGACFEGINKHAYLIHVLANGVPLPDGLLPTVALLLRGLLARDRNKRWQWNEVQAWLNGEAVNAPEATHVEYDANSGPSIALNGRPYYKLPLFALAAAEEKHWEEARDHLIRGVITTWGEQAQADPKVLAGLRQVVRHDNLDDDFKLSVALKLLNPAMPLIHKGEIVTPGWLLAHPLEGYTLISGPAPDLLGVLESENWLSRLKARMQQVRHRAKNLEIELNEEVLHIYLLSTSRAHLTAQWNERRSLFPDTDHTGLLSLIERQQISEEDLIVVLSASLGQFRSIEIILAEAAELAKQLDIAAFDRTAAQELLGWPRQDIYRSVNERIEGFARCSIKKIDEWADQFRLDRRIALVRALVLLGVPQEHWLAPQRQQYVSQILDFFEKKIAGTVMRGPLVRMTIGKTTARVDLSELGTSRRSAQAILDQLLLREEHITTLDPAAFTPSTTVEHRLTALSRNANLYKRDTGIDGLCLGFPFLLMRDARGNTKPRIAPVLLWPIKIIAEVGNRGHFSIAFDREREEVRLNPAFEGMMGIDSAKRWKEAANQLLGNSAVRAADVMDALGMLASPRQRTLTGLPASSVNVEIYKSELSCSAVLFHVTFIGQAIVEDLRQLKSIPPTGTGLETALRASDQLQEALPVAPVSEIDRYFTVACDPSQEAAVLQARHAPGLLIEGPPGTGKSQTIVNMVADTIGRKQSMLIVCQKQAALEVVRKRLQAEGLGERIVMVTDVHRDREPVIRAVREQFDVIVSRPAGGAPAWRRQRERIAARIEALEAELDRHHAALHRVDERMGLTYRTLLGELIELEKDYRPFDVPALRSLLASFDTGRLATIEESCAPLVRYWLPSRYEGSALAQLQRFSADKATLDSFNSYFAAFLAAEIHRDITIKSNPTTFEVEDPEPHRAWLNTYGEKFRQLSDDQRRNLAQWMPYFRQASAVAAANKPRGGTTIEALKTLSAGLNTLDASAHDTLLFSHLRDRSTAELNYWIASAASVTAPASWFGRLNPVRYLRRRKLSSFLASKGDLATTARMLALLDAAKLEAQLRPLRKEADALHMAVNIKLHHLPQASLLDLKLQVSATQHALEEVAELTRAIDVSPQAELIELTLRHATRASFDALVAGYDAAFLRFQARTDSLLALQSLASWFEPAWITACRTAIAKNLSTLSSTKGISEALSTLGPYQQYRTRIGQLDADAMSVFAMLREKHDALQMLPAQALEPIVRGILNREARLAWKLRLEQEEQALLLERSEIDSKIASLAAADSEMRKLNRSLLIEDVDLSNLGSRTAWEDITRLRGQRARRLREFIDHGADLGLMALRPIWLMNPDVASRLLPLKAAMFDTVIYDEASQMPIEYALPTLFRGHVVVVSGDEKQMPPTAFFSSRVESDEADLFDGEEPEEDASEEERSAYEETWNRREIKDCPDLLLLARSVLPTTTLQIHYRSAYRELIGFSNASFYGNRLSIPVRHPEEKVRQDKPITFVRVDGVYQNQTNPEEAEKVVEILATLWQRPFTERSSVGVVTFNRKQADLIEEALEARSEINVAFRVAYAEERQRTEGGEDMGVFVKNVENVQGDERDIIIFSSTFGRNSQGTFRRIFGVLGQNGGERRLNVAVTRARKKIVMVTSMPIGDISDMLGTHQPPSRPRDYLQGYLEYARAMSDGEFSAGQALLTRLVTERSADRDRQVVDQDGFSDAVAEFVGSLGWPTAAANEGDAFGLDYAIEDARTGLYAIGIECDAPRHRLLATARAREIWRPTVMQKTIPVVHRVSSHGWYHENEQERSLLKAAIESALK